MSHWKIPGAAVALAVLVAGCGGGGAQPSVAASPVSAASAPPQPNQAATMQKAGGLPPEFYSPAASAVATNTATVAYVAAATDPEGATVTYVIAGGPDAALFIIDAKTGEVRFAVAPRFESPSDADRDNVYKLTLSASDGVSKASKDITITVRDMIVTL